MENNNYENQIEEVTCVTNDNEVQNTNGNGNGKLLIGVGLGAAITMLVNFGLKKIKSFRDKKKYVTVEMPQESEGKVVVKKELLNEKGNK